MRHLRTRRNASISGRFLKYLKGLLQCLIEFHNRSHISTTVVIIWSRPNSHQFLIKHVLVALHYKLMGPGDQRYTVILAECVHWFFAEDETGAPLGGRPALDLIRIGPHHIAHYAFLGDLFYTFDGVDFGNVLDLGR